MSFVLWCALGWAIEDLLVPTCTGASQADLFVHRPGSARSGPRTEIAILSVRHSGCSRKTRFRKMNGDLLARLDVSAETCNPSSYGSEAL